MMKHRITNMAAVILLSAIPAGAQVVDIPDAELEKVIRHHLDRPSGDILRADMERITVLDASSTARRSYATLADGGYPVAIRSLEGIEAAINLKVLDLSSSKYRSENVEIEDLSPLGALANLESLDMSYNQLARIDLPDGMGNLVELNVGHNALVHFRFPEGLDHLRRLYLGWNQLTGLELPASVSQLTRLDLHGMPSLYGLRSLPPGWLVVPESMSNLWVRFGYAGMYSGCGLPSFYRQPVYFTFVGTHKHRIADLRMLGTGEVELTVAGDIGDRVSVEYMGDEPFWYNTLDFVNESGVEVIRLPQSESATALYRLRLLRPDSGESWPYVPYHGGGGGEE